MKVAREVYGKEVKQEMIWKMILKRFPNIENDYFEKVKKS